MAYRMARRPAARTHTDLETWQIADELRQLVFKATRTGGAATDFRFRDQLCDAVRSACRNTSEGFYRYDHGEFGHLLKVAYASLGEALDCIGDGCDCNYFSQEAAAEMNSLAKRAMGANLRLRQSWQRPGKDQGPRRRRRAPRT